MNPELELKLMAHVDGELSGREAREVEQLLAENAEARALVTELKSTAGFLRGNEPKAALQESPEFYWSKIERAISVAPAETAPGRWQWVYSWRKYLAPVTGFAVVMLLAVNGMRDTEFSLFAPKVRHLTEVENESEHMSSFSFRSHAEKMIVVWVYDKSSDSGLGDKAAEEAVEDDDLVIQ